MTYVHRLIYQHVETVVTPRPSCLDSDEYPVILALRQLCPGESITFDTVTVYRVAFARQKPRYRVTCGERQVTVFGEREAARRVLEWSGM